jgi:hypothetical protein
MLVGVPFSFYFLLAARLTYLQDGSHTCSMAHILAAWLTYLQDGSAVLHLAGRLCLPNSA